MDQSITFQRTNKVLCGSRSRSTSEEKARALRRGVREARPLCFVIQEEKEDRYNQRSDSCQEISCVNGIVLM